MNHGRRAFFQSLIPGEYRRKSVMREPPPLIVVGAVSDFPVGSETKIGLPQGEFVVRSLPEGLQFIRVKTNESLRLSLGSDGRVRAHLNEKWPHGAVLSMFSGEIYNI
ncbi:MAG: hypothetical protein HC902_13380 [Calothrix sp. SM1_5_4]|nr:hypothetical protein [Calothrix sp. SM1_5_4]